MNAQIAEAQRLAREWDAARPAWGYPPPRAPPARQR